MFKEAWFPGLFLFLDTDHAAECQRTVLVCGVLSCCILSLNQLVKALGSVGWLAGNANNRLQEISV